MKVGRIFAGIGGALIALVAIGLLIGGGALMWAYGTQRDADGYITSQQFELTTASNALTSTEIDLGSEQGDWWPTDLATVRINAESQLGDDVFVGIGPSADVATYLAGTAYEQVTDLGPSTRDITYEAVAGEGTPTAPGAETFWVASSEGAGEQTLTWEVDSGEWAVVVMNADATPGVSVDIAAGVRLGVLLAIAIGLLIGGLVFGGFAAMLLVWAARGAEAEPDTAAVQTAAAGRYPLVLEGSLDPKLSRGLWLVKWLLAFPHFIVLAFLWVAFALLTVVAFFAILFTGRYPRGIFDFNVGVMRWTWRVSFYSYSALATDRYPPFTLAEVADYPAHLDVAYPEKLSRGLVLVKWWLLAIPQYLIVGLFTSGLIWYTTDLGNGDQILELGGGLIGLLVIIAALALLFTGRYPQGIFDLVMGLNRWTFRVGAYAALMRDEYPPFRLDMGGSESGIGTGPPPAGNRGTDAAPLPTELVQS